MSYTFYYYYSSKYKWDDYQVKGNHYRSLLILGVGKVKIDDNWEHFGAY